MGLYPCVIQSSYRQVQLGLCIRLPPEYPSAPIVEKRGRQPHSTTNYIDGSKPRVITLVSLLIIAVGVGCSSSDQRAIYKAVSIVPLTQPASAITHPPANMSNVNGMHEILRSEKADIRFGTQADPSTVTLGPTNGELPNYPHTKARTVLTSKCR